MSPLPPLSDVRVPPPSRGRLGGGGLRNPSFWIFGAIAPPDGFHRPEMFGIVGTPPHLTSPARGEELGLFCAEVCFRENGA